MAKSENQKSKLLHLANILLTETDEEHGLTTNELIEKLAALEIKAERKSIYSDIETLQDFGLDIIQNKAKRTTYFVGSRDFELSELKLLVDAITASRFIPEEKSRSLIAKLGKLTSRNEAGKLSRQVTLSGRAKTKSNTVLYAIDTLHNAIGSNCQVEFYYTNRTPQKETVRRNDGKPYRVSPWQLVWDDENYYLLAFDPAKGEMRNYRVDRMEKVKLQQELPREGYAEFEKLDMGRYTAQTFGMFGGNPEKVVLKCENGMANVILDRFGDDVFLVPGNDGTFKAHVSVVASDVFFGWLAGYGKKIVVSEPQDVRDRTTKLLEEAADAYK